MLIVEEKYYIAVGVGVGAVAASAEMCMGGIACWCIGSEWGIAPCTVVMSGILHVAAVAVSGVLCTMQWGIGVLHVGAVMVDGILRVGKWGFCMPVHWWRVGYCMLLQ